MVDVTLKEKGAVMSFMKGCGATFGVVAALITIVIVCSTCGGLLFN